MHEVFDKPHLVLYISKLAGGIVRGEWSYQKTSILALIQCRKAWYQGHIFCWLHCSRKHYEMSKKNTKAADIKEPTPSDEEEERRQADFILRIEQVTTDDEDLPDM